MVKQSLPDMFYYWMIIATMVLSMTSTVWSLAIIYAIDKDRASSEMPWARYVPAIIGFLTSLAVMIVLLAQYGLHDTIVGLNEQRDVSSLIGTAMWATFIIHVVTIPAMLCFMAWYYFHPIQHVPRDS